MSFVYEITLQGAPDLSEAAAQWLAGRRENWARLADLVSLDSYANAEQSAADPYNNDGRGPLLIVMFEFANKPALAAAVNRIATVAGDLPAGVTATGAAMERLYYPVGTSSVPAPLEATLSYVVRYTRPADDEDAFRANYLATHPQTQAHMPLIRAIMCYLPIDELNTGLPSPDYMVGNEVVFDSVADLNVAMQSPVREELRAHYREFPRFSGKVTHFPMDRTRHVG